MFILPLDHFEIYTKIKPHEVVQKLCSVVETQRYWGIFYERSEKTYWGSIKGSKFNISRKIWYRNSALPVIEGEIHPAGKGSHINITMRLSWCALGFIAFWLGMVGVMFINFSSDWLISVLQQGLDNSPFLEVLIPVGFFIFGYFLVTLLPYKIEAGISENFLYDLFETNPETNVVFHNKFLGLNNIQILILFLLLNFVFVTFTVLFKLISGSPS